MTNDTRSHVFEDPNAAAEKNRAVFARKFETQKDRIIDGLTLVVQREGDRSNDRDKLFSAVNPRDLGRTGRYAVVLLPRTYAPDDLYMAGEGASRFDMLYSLCHYSTSGTQAMDTSLANSTLNSDAWTVKFIDLA